MSNVRLDEFRAKGLVLPEADQSVVDPLSLEALKSVWSTKPDINGLVRDTRPAAGDRRSEVAPSQRPFRCARNDGVSNKQVETGLLSSDINPVQWTVMLWLNSANIASATLSRRFFNSFRAPGNSNIIISTAVSSIELWVHDGTTPVTVTKPISANTWYHVAATYDGVTARLYVNAVLVGSVAVTMIAGHASPCLSLGNGTQAADGMTSDLRVINETFTEAEVLDVYRNGVRAQVDRSYLLWYLYDEQSPFIVDSSGNNRHGKPIGMVLDKTGFFAEPADRPPLESSSNVWGYTPAMKFLEAGASSSHLIVNNPVFDIRDVSAKPFTAAARVRIEYDTALAQTIFSIGNANYQSLTLEATGLSNNLRLTRSNTAGTNWAFTLSPTGSPEHQWFWAILTRDASGVYTIYQDADVKISQTVATDLVIANPNMLKIGGHYNFTAGYSWNNHMSEFRFWSEALSPAQISELIAGGNPLPNELEVHYDLTTEEIDKPIVDLSGKDRHATPVNVFCTRFPVRGTDPNTSLDGGPAKYSGETPYDAVAKQSNCATFNGVSRITFPAIDDGRFDFQPTDVLDLQCYLQTSTDGREPFGKMNHASPYQGWGFSIDVGGYLCFNLVRAYTTSRIYFRGPAIDDGVMRHCRILYDGSSQVSGVRMFLDGVEVFPSSTINTLNGVIDYAGRSFSVGARNASLLFYDGQMAGLKIVKNGTLILDVPFAEGPRSRNVFDKVSGLAGTLISADVSEGGVFWGTRQDAYHHNLSEGFDDYEMFSGTEADGITVGSNQNFRSQNFTIKARGIFRNSFTNPGNYYHSIWSNDALTHVNPFYCQHLRFAQTTGTQPLVLFSWNNAAAAFSVNSYISFEHGLSDGDFYELEAHFESGYQYLRLNNQPPVEKFINTTVTYYDQDVRIGKSNINIGGVGNYLCGELHDVVYTDHEDARNNYRFVPGGKTIRYPKSHPFISQDQEVMHNGAESLIDQAGGVTFSSKPLPVNLITEPAYTAGTAYWQGAAFTVGQDLGVLGPTGQLDAYVISAGASNAWVGWEPPVTLSHLKTYNWSVWLKRRSGSGIIQLNVDPYNGVWVTVPVTGEWQRFEVSSIPAATVSPLRVAGLLISTAGDSVYASRPQLIETNDPGQYTPYGLINSLDSNWQFPNKTRNPIFNQHVSDGYGNVRSVSKSLVYSQPFIPVPVWSPYKNAAIDAIDLELSDPAGLIFDDFGSLDQETLGLDWRDLVLTGTPRWRITNKTALEGIDTSSLALHRRQLKTASQEVTCLVSFNDGAGTGKTFQIYVYGDEDFSEGYSFVVKDAATVTYRVFRVVDRLSTTMIGAQVDAAVPWTDGVPFEVKVRVEDNILKGYINGDEVISRDISAVDYSDNRHAGFLTAFTTERCHSFKARDLIV